MNTKRIIHIVLLTIGIAMVTAALRSAEAGIEFTALMKDGKGFRCVLTSKSIGVSAWLTTGQKFDGYTVGGLDASAETLTVTRDGVESRLRLTPSKVKPGAGEPSPEIKQRVLRNLRMLAAAADQFFLERGVVRASYDELVGPTKFVREILPVDGEDYRSLLFEQGKLIEVRTSQGYAISYRP